MKSAVFQGKRDIRVEEREIPKLGPDEVLIKVMACGICGSDLHIFEGDQGSTSTTPPQVQGHEFSGIIAGVGNHVNNFKIGDKVCVDPADNCGECYYCVSGMMSHCDNMRAIGTNVDGGFSQYCKVKARLVLKLDESVSFIEGAMAEPLACCINGIDRSNIKVGDSVLIYGAGTIGLLMLQLAKLKGAGKVIIVEPVKERRETAVKLGADITVDPFEENLKDVLAANGVCHVRVVIECIGLKSTSEEAVEIVDKQGTILMFAVTAVEATIALKSYLVFQKEISVCGSFCSPYTMTRAVELLNSHKIDVMPMIGGTGSLEDVSEILSNPQKRAKGKVMILPNGGETI